MSVGEKSGKVSGEESWGKREGCLIPVNPWAQEDACSFLTCSSSFGVASLRMYLELPVMLSPSTSAQGTAQYRDGAVFTFPRSFPCS